MIRHVTALMLGLTAVSHAHAETLADWQRMPQAVRATTAAEAAAKIHDPTFPMGRRELAAHLLGCLDKTALGGEKEMDVMLAVRACAQAVRGPH
jgi:hypothetical protein